MVNETLHCDCWEQLQQLQSDKETSISQLRRQLSDNSAKLDCVQQEYGVYEIATSKVGIVTVHSNGN